MAVPAPTGAKGQYSFLVDVSHLLLYSSWVVKVKHLLCSTVVFVHYVDQTSRHFKADGLRSTKGQANKKLRLPLGYSHILKIASYDDLDVRSN